MPMGPYKNFDECVRDQRKKGHSEESAKKICGSIKKKVEGKGELVVLIPPSIEQFIPRLSDYFGVWAVEESAASSLLSYINDVDVSAHVANAIEQRKITKVATPPVNLPKYNIAQIDLRGVLMKSESSVMDSTSTVKSRRLLRQASDDSTIDGILFKAESPGGSYAGNYELAREISAVKKNKPVGFYIEDLGASALYWLSSQADFINVNEAGLVGSVGTMMVIYDTSKSAEKAGISVRVYKRGAFKAIGTPGSEITEEHSKYLDTLIGKMDSLFKADVSSGRNISIEKITEWEAKMFVAKDAKAEGLVDNISTYEEAIQELVDRIDSSRKTVVPVSSRKAFTMTFDDLVTVAGLKEACPGATSAFIVEQLESGVTTIGESMQAWSSLQAKELLALKTKAAEVPIVPKNEGVKVGVVKNVSGASEEQDCSDFDSLVREYMKFSSCDRKQAIISVAKRNPDAHKAYLLALPGNKRRSIKAKIEDRFEEAEELLQGA